MARRAGQTVGWWLIFLAILAPVPASRADEAEVTAAVAARLPAPGSSAPADLAFAPDGKSITYLLSEQPDTLQQLLWQFEVQAGESRILTRPPGEGTNETNISREEALRRERQRQRSTGITQVVRAHHMDLRVFPLQGDLYLQRGDGPLQRLTETPAAEIDPQFAPDDSRLAFVRDGELFVIDLDTRLERQLTTGAADGLTHGLAEFIAQEELGRQTGLWWSPDGAALAYQETDERHIPAYVIAHQGGDAFSTETHRYPFAGQPNARVRLGIVPAVGGPTRWLDLNEGQDEPAYLARVSWPVPGQLWVQSIDRDQKRLRLVRITPDSGESVTLVDERQPDGWIDLHDDLTPIANADQFIWSSAASGRKRLELRRSTGELVRVLTPENCAVDELLTVDSARGEAWFTGHESSPLEAHVYRVSLEGGPIRKLTDEPGMHRAVVAADGSLFVDVYSNVETPPRTILRDREGRQHAVIHDASRDPRLATLKLQPPEFLALENRAGVTLQGALYRPGSALPESATPLIVMVYGGPTVQTVTNSWGMTSDMTAQFYLARGFAVWKCDNRGSSRRDRAFQEPVAGNLGTLEVEDQVDGVRFITGKQGWINPAQVGITGGSYGGYMTLRCLALASDVFRAGVSVAPVTFWEGYDTAYTERYMGRPEENRAGYDRASVLGVADRIEGKLLIVHGLIDENVHFRHTARLIEALLAAAAPFEVLPIPEERHGVRRPEVREQVLIRAAAFFRTAFPAAD